MVNINIDEKRLTVPDNLCVLEAALQNGIYIPHLCHHADLPELGSCRLCIVEVDGVEGVVPSCTLKVKDGMVIRTKSERIDKLRNLSMELLLAAHPGDCTTCPKYGACELQKLIMYMGVSSSRVRNRIKGFASNTSNPLFIHDMNRCVLCGRCVRACNDLRGVKVLQYNKKGLETYVGTLHDKLLSDAGCRFCGACAEVCPTGTIRDVMNYNAAEKKDTLIPCRANCPAHTDIPRYVRFASQGKYAEASAVIHEKLPFPECLGYVCAHKCELKCRRGEVNEPISIREIKRFSVEHDNDALWIKNGKHLPATGKKVCVVGGGPSGLTAAFYLAKQGHSVTLKEKYPKLGGQMQYGIPSYRLPREVVDRETGYVKQAGVKVETGVSVDSSKKLLSEYDAVLIAIGNHSGVRLPITGSSLPGVLTNTDFLRDASMGVETGIGRRVVVLGGGNVAFDCARTAKRLGAEKIVVACLEPRDGMTADEEEIKQAQEEGIAIHPAQSFEKINGVAKAESVTFMNVKSFTFDENHRAVIEKETGSEHVVESDTVIFAVGQRTEISKESGIELGGCGVIKTEDGGAETSVEGIFACGDAAYGTKTVIDAIVSGREAASEIDRYLGGDGDISEVLAPKYLPDSYIGKIENFGSLERKKDDILPAKERENNFNMVDRGLSSNNICAEAGRCLQCDLRFNISQSRCWSDYSDGETEESK